MSVFFGTDGLRGVAGVDLSFEVAYKCGNSLSGMVQNGGKVLIAKDSRVSGDMIVTSLASGLMAGGVNVTYLGTAPTSSVAYLVKLLGFDYGVMITASHNPPEYNGIKIFSSKGEKLTDKEEEKVERGFIKQKRAKMLCEGKFEFKPSLVKLYSKYVQEIGTKLYGMRIVLDCSNGATSFVAPQIFSKLGAKVYKLSAKADGKRINQNCGSLHTKNLVEKVKKVDADFGFAFDGDGDRLIAVDEKGNVVDGDGILTALATCFKEQGMLSQNKVVGTSQTNIGVEKTLEERGISLERADVGDKYVLDMMKKHSLLLGGEQSGHIIVRKYLQTGDGIITAVLFASFAKQKNKTASELSKVHKFPQFNADVVVKEKLRILGSEKLANATLQVQQELAGRGRVLVRASGTEPKIRIMVESEDKDVSKRLAEFLAEVVREGEKEDELCAE